MAITTTKDVLTKYLMGNQEDMENATLMSIRQTCDQIAIRLKTTFKTFDFIHLLNSDDTLTCFLHQLTLQPLYWNVIYSILAAAKLMNEASISHDQGFRVNEIIDKVTSYMTNNDIESWIENLGGWENITHY